VSVISTAAECDQAWQAGAFSTLAKPIPSRDHLDKSLAELLSFLKRSSRELLVIDADPERRAQVQALLGHQELEHTVAETGQDALRLLSRRHFDCVLMPPDLPDLGLDDFLERLRQSSRPQALPVLLYPAGVPGVALVPHLGGPGLALQYGATPERLVDQANLILHRRLAELPERQRQMIAALHAADSILAGRQVLIVDDDIRNIFALTSVLERFGVEIHSAENGRDAILLLQQTPGVDAVLMDIMMPEMDGMDTIRAIRAMPQFRNLPIIAVTAKAMKGDREKCLEAGAWDYLSKPVDPEQMLEVLRAWIRHPVSR